MSTRYVRGFGAAVVAVAALVTAANAGPARAAQPEPLRHVQDVSPHGFSPQDVSVRDGATG
ncbi:hypothetical protein ABZ876_05600 [Streptomyces sp. NPDC046931]|uniref:hypothetical protein n=1 Tax=Streptomyces sp. NPDC046931 TaxID=3154806 RepID=UPI0033CBB3C8